MLSTEDVVDSILRKYKKINFRVCRAIEVDIMVTKWERQVEDNKKLPKNLQVKIPAMSDELVPKRWESVAIGALQEAGEAYLVGEFIFYIKKKIIRGINDQ